MFYFSLMANPKSYPGSGTTWTDLTSNGRNGTLSGITFSTDHISFDGSNDKLTFSSNISIPVHNGFTFWVVWDLPTQTNGAGIIFYTTIHQEITNTNSVNMELIKIHSIIKIIFLMLGTKMTTSLGSGYGIYALEKNSDGKSYTSVNGATPTVKEPGSNSYWKQLHPQLI